MNKFLKFLLGTFVALLLSFVFGCILFRLFTGMNPLQEMVIFSMSSVASKAFSLGSIPNIALFYFFLNRENYFSARGVIFSFIIIGFYIILG
ncbi:hypothetical protein MG290_05490 [Flavobacterium sp. CBA20B-1]|uniref:Uncharacterized protein n=1 Tax=Paenimyroides aestuarii TaxID=2968490 RepID=A0ABY5NPG8_9FLAO|nr:MULTISPECIES: hypothetical protein [Flavobacteriaceae]UUV20451.1 hypothetical protein NPX36_08725 [Paenimyroides aestuarii]WCM43124.1 hypothetical protein MG290_05490 [Flavobacterium sp. CBA20B-1]